VPTPEFVASLEDLGGLGLFIFVVVAAVIGLWRQWWVPGWMYKKVETENDLLVATVTRLTDQLARERARNVRLAADARRLGGSRASDASR